MRHVEPAVFLIGRPTLDEDETRRWLNSLGADKYEIPGDEAATAAEVLVNLCGKRCYMSFQVGLNPNISKVRTDMADFIDNILKVGHGSVIEHASYSFAIENVSRVFTGEMNRHRAGMAISEGSMRYIRFEDIPYWIPTSIKEQEEKSIGTLYTDGKPHPTTNEKRSMSRRIFERAFQQAEENYARLVEIWKDELSPESKFHAKKQITSMMRRVIPMGVATGGVWTGNLRALRHIFTMRCDEAAEEEILLVASLMLEKMIETEPNFFKDFTKNEKGFWCCKYFKV